MASTGSTVSVSVKLHPIFVEEMIRYIDRIHELGLDVSEAEIRARVDLYWSLWPPDAQLVK